MQPQLAGEDVGQPWLPCRCERAWRDLPWWDLLVFDSSRRWGLPGAPTLVSLLCPQ